MPGDASRIEGERIMELITTHKNVDFDALASVFAARLLYPQAIIMLPRTLNPNTRAFLSIHKDVFPFHTSKDIEAEDISRLVVVDVNHWTRLEGMDGLIEKPGIEIHLWDHHSTPGNIKPDWLCCEHLGATVSLLVRQLEGDGVDLSSIQATLFLAGIYEDTGNLTFPTTTGIDARSVAFLLGQGADLGIVANFLRPVYGPKQKDVLFEMLKTAERLDIDGCTVSINKATIDGHTPGLALVVNMYQDIMNVDAAFGVFLDVKRDQCTVIGRSSGENPDIGAIMRRMGGGGHQNAGSAVLKSVTPETVAEQIAKMIRVDPSPSVLIGDRMSYPVMTTSPQTPMKEVALLLRETGCTGIPVVEGDEVVGIVSRRDFKRVKKSSQLNSPVKAFMSGKLIHIHPEKRVEEAARLMVKHDIGRLPVVEEGKLIGIITRSDVMRYYYDLLPTDTPHDTPDLLLGNALSH